MAITAEQRKEVISLLVGMFDAAPSAALLTGFVASIENGQSLEALANDLAATDEFASLYPVWLTNEEFATNFVTNILDGNTSAAALAEGIATVTAMLNGGSTRGEAANQAVALLTAVPVTDTIWGQAAQGLANKVDVATYFATTKLTAASEFDALRAVVADVDATATSVSDQKILIDAGVESLVQNLTTGQDFLEGSNGNDTFKAWIFDNQNTAQSGDSIEGGAGTDTLIAEIGESQNFSISLKTDSVDVAHFRAQEGWNGDNGDNNVVNSSEDGPTDQNAQIDAGDMNGTVEFWSTDSRANLVIEDVQTNSHLTTIGFRNSDSGEVDLEVYFDNITAPGSTTAGSQLFLEVLDLEGMRTSGEPLKDNPYIGVQFSMDGTNVTVTAPTPVQTSYADLVAGINAELATLGLTNVTATLGSSFTAINSDNGVAYEGTTVVLTNTGPEVLAGVGWVVDGVLPPDSNVHTSIDDTPPATSTQLTQTDVIFDYVGSGSKGGDFTAGEISQKGGGTSNSGTPGIQQFNIDVDRNSWLQEVKSTEDTLEAVYVESIGAEGTLRIDELRDVQTFNATAMNNSTILTASLGGDVVDKYFDLTDEQDVVASDNSEFNYSFGGSADVLTMSVSQEALAYEDFELMVSTGAGNDRVTLSNTATTDENHVGATNWLANHAALNNVVVSTGSGDDTITTLGAGEVVIMAGSGNDTVYTDNSGAAKGEWVVNSSNSPGTAEVQTLTITADGVDDGDETMTVTYDADGDGGVTTANVVVNLAAIDPTDVAAVATAVAAGLNGDVGFSALATATAAAGVVTVTYTAAGGDQDTQVSAAVGGTTNTLAGAGATTTGGVAATGPTSADLLGNALASGILFGSTVTVTYSGPEAALVNGGNALANSEGYESSETVIVPLTNYLGNQSNVNQAIKEAINSDAVLSKLLSVEDGPNNTLVIDALVDGVHVAEDIAITVTAPTLTALSTGEQTALQTAYESFVGDSTATLTQGILNGYASAAQTTSAPALTATGAAANHGGSDNTINLGAGDDVLVLSTDTDSNENIVFTGTSIGVNTVVNFTLANDVLVFTDYLNGNEDIPGSGSTESQTRIATTDTVDNAASINATANEVVIINDFAANATETWAGLGSAELLAALIDANNDSSSDWGNLAEGTVTEDADLVGTTQKNIILVESDVNDGMYKVFEVTSTVGATDEFSAASLLGQVDFGDTIDATAIIA